MWAATPKGVLDSLLKLLFIHLQQLRSRHILPPLDREGEGDSVLFNACFFSVRVHLISLFFAKWGGGREEFCTATLMDLYGRHFLNDDFSTAFLRRKARALQRFLNQDCSQLQSAGRSPEAIVRLMQTDSFPGSAMMFHPLGPWVKTNTWVNKYIFLAPLPSNTQDQPMPIF